MNNELTMNSLMMDVDVMHESESGPDIRLIRRNKPLPRSKIFDKKCNGCDGAHHTINVHFTKACPYNCPFCIDKKSKNTAICSAPNVIEILDTIKRLSPEYKDVLIVGGEPLMYPHELLRLIIGIHETTKLKVYVTSTLPDTLYPFQLDRLTQIIIEADGFNWSIQHVSQETAMAMRGSQIEDSRYTDWRMDFFDNLRDSTRKKVRVNLNLVSPWLMTQEELLFNLIEIDNHGFGSIKISELQGCPNRYVSFERIMGIKLPSAYSHGCITDIDMSPWISHMVTPVILKRSCFMVEDSLKASFSDGLKVCYKRFVKPKNDFVVVYEDGHTNNHWE